MGGLAGSIRGYISHRHRDTEKTLEIKRTLRVRPCLSKAEHRAPSTERNWTEYSPYTRAHAHPLSSTIIITTAIVMVTIVHQSAGLCARPLLRPFPFRPAKASMPPIQRH